MNYRDPNALSEKTRIALALHPQDSYIVQKLPGAAPPLTHTTWKDTVYDGAELRPSSTREGAMDAYKLPSRGQV